jgi:hypothetical protein
MVIIAKKGIPDVTYRDIAKDLERFLRNPSGSIGPQHRRAKHAKTDPDRGDQTL